MILLACGLVIAVILSWIYDITPEGIVKTPAADQVESEKRLQDDIGITKGEQAIADQDDDSMVQANKLYADKINKYKKKEKIYSLGSVAVIIAAVILFFFSSGSTLPFSKRDWIIITDFENLTGNPVFDKSLYTAFSLTINQSRYINVFPRNRMLETMAMMEIEDPTYIDERTGREIASREGISTYIVPSISEVGNNYVLSAKIMETKSGNLLQSVIVESDNQQDILSKLDRMSRNVRRTLGEPRYHIATQDKPLAKVTTSSLEALKQYSMGIESHWLRNFTDAREYYENALRIDSTFTSARASLGNLLIERFGDQKGKKLLNRAVKNVDDLTDIEKYGILAFHAVNVDNDFQKGIEYTQELTRLYPDDPGFHNNLGYYYTQAGIYDKAVEEYKKTVALAPGKVLTYGGLIWNYLTKMGEIDSALIYSRKMIADNPQNAWGYFYLGSSYVGLDSLNKAVKAFLKAREINPYLLDNQYRLALTYQMQGYYNEAIRLMERMIEIDQYDAWAYFYLGINYDLSGDEANANKYFSLFRDIATGPWLETYPDIPQTYIVIAKVAAYQDDIEYSNRMLKKAFELDSTYHQLYADVYCIQGKIPEALAQIDKALENGYRDFVWLKIDPDLKELHNNERFRELLDEYFEK
ncbi:MAG: tetratricopeptide repeat protein [Bacteroidota bacterium]|nr:tetratricopeptide repeat protein [Bacteroidota bacterium]